MEATQEINRFTCIKCRKQIFDASYVGDHTSNAKDFKTRPHKKAKVSLQSHGCSSYFLERIDFLAHCFEEGQQQGKLTCPTPGCGQKLGNYCHHGLQCSCGAWVCPAYQIHKTSVDQVQNVQQLVIDIRTPVFTSEELKQSEDAN